MCCLYLMFLLKNVSNIKMIFQKCILLDRIRKQYPALPHFVGPLQTSPTVAIAKKSQGKLLMTNNAAYIWQHLSRWFVLPFHSHHYQDSGTDNKVTVCWERLWKIMNTVFCLNQSPHQFYHWRLIDHSNYPGHCLIRMDSKIQQC